MIFCSSELNITFRAEKPSRISRFGQNTPHNVPVHEGWSPQAAITRVSPIHYSACLLAIVERNVNIVKMKYIISILNKIVVQQKRTKREQRVLKAPQCSQYCPHHDETHATKWFHCDALLKSLGETHEFWSRRVFESF